MDVERHLRGPELLGVLSLRRLLPSLWIGEKRLHAVRTDRLGLLQGALRRKVRADDPLLPRHRTKVSRTPPQHVWGRVPGASPPGRQAPHQGLSGSAPDLRAGTTASARRPSVSAPSISPKSRSA